MHFRQNTMVSDKIRRNISAKSMKERLKLVGIDIKTSKRRCKLRESLSSD